MKYKVAYCNRGEEVMQNKDKEINYCCDCVHCTDDYVVTNGKKMHHCFMKSCLVDANDEICEEFEEEEYK